MFSTAALGIDFELIDESGKILKQENAIGEIALIPPSFGLSTLLLNRDHFSVYFKGMPKGLRRHGDQMQRIGKYYRAQGRADDTMNLGGIKVSSVELERVCNGIEFILETASIAYNPPNGGPSQLVVFVVMNTLKSKMGEITEESLKSQLQGIIKKKLNPLFHISDVIILETLPRTASNKVMRRVLRKKYSEYLLKIQTNPLSKI